MVSEADLNPHDQKAVTSTLKLAACQFRHPTCYVVDSRFVLLDPRVQRKR